jgi:hypothetical protein
MNIHISQHMQLTLENIDHNKKMRTLTQKLIIRKKLTLTPTIRASNCKNTFWVSKFLQFKKIMAALEDKSNIKIEIT